MISLNRGEWSELYCVLFLLVKPKIQVVDEKLNVLNSDLYEIKKIIAETNFPLEYEIVNDRIIIYALKEKIKEYLPEEIEKHREELYQKIISADAAKGSFTIESLEEFLRDFSLNQVLKSKSELKEDIETMVLDKKVDLERNIKYSIKSSLGSPATLLNSSGHTNFKYKVSNINDSIMKNVNIINSKTKLLDRLNYLYSNGAKIEFDTVVSECFLYNLKMIDSQMDRYIANTLLYSYVSNNKKLKEIFIESNNFADINIANKKLSDFLIGVSFGFFPGKKWDGNNSVNGGILLVKEDGEVVLLDLIYYSDIVKKYLINNTQLDSPSSTRYHMLEVFKENGNYYFTLNLQIRYTRNLNY